MKGLLIEFDVNTGRRSGSISPQDPGLRCHGWQNLNVTPQIEIRVIYDERDVSQYEGVTGVIVLKSKVEINEAIDKHIPTVYSIGSEALFREHMGQKKIKLDLIKGDTQEILKELHGRGIKGVVERRPNKV